jgi:hypothetical protein
VTPPRARIAWLPPEQGGRGAPPAGPRYSTPARFEVAWEAWARGQAWSLVLDLVSHPIGLTDWIAEVRFLVDEAPQELITEGARFELYEGKKCVGHGTVLAAVPAAVMPQE